MAHPVDPTFGRHGNYTTSRTANEAFRANSAAFSTPTSNMYHGNGRQESLSIWQKIMMRADSIRDAMGDKCCRCLHHMPSLVLIIGILVLIGLAIAAVPVAFVLVSNAGGTAEPLQGDAVPTGSGTFFHPIRHGLAWPGYNEDDDDSEQEQNDDQEVRVTSTAALFPPNVSLCHGFGFACASQPSRVISTSARCDGKADCDDGSDEMNCRECQTPYWCELPAAGEKGAARVRLCLRAEQLCDGVRHCPDATDETKFCHSQKTECPEGTRRCSDSPLCLSADSFCDGHPDCRNDEDEAKCTECTREAKMCAATGQCVPRSQLCDGVVNCPDGSDEMDCDCKSCSGSGRALCSNGRCLSRSMVCDGTIDCEDGLDEQNCPGTCRAPTTGNISTSAATVPTVQCSDGTYYPTAEVCAGRVRNPACTTACPKCDDKLAFACADGQCIRKDLMCDGNVDCAGGEDESGCKESCSSSRGANIFKCASGGKCIASSDRCNGVQDCQDDSDESNCDKCPSDAVRCSADARCLPKIARCDGVADCSDGADEAGCTCEECTGAHSDTYACEKSQHCFRRDAVCDPYSKCPNATHNDKLFCAAKALQKDIF